MNRAIPIFALYAGVVLCAAGCSKTDSPPASEVPRQAPSTQGSLEAPPVPKLPDPVVPKGADASSPMPGQAGDTSNEAFKGGGKPDPHK